jgi:hypothetical protein
MSYTSGAISVTSGAVVIGRGYAGLGNISSAAAVAAPSFSREYVRNRSPDGGRIDTLIRVREDTPDIEHV